MNTQKLTLRTFNTDNVTVDGVVITNSNNVFSKTLKYREDNKKYRRAKKGEKILIDNIVEDLVKNYNCGCKTVETKEIKKSSFEGGPEYQ